MYGGSNGVLLLGAIRRVRDARHVGLRPTNSLGYLLITPGN